MDDVKIYISHVKRYPTSYLCTFTSLFPHSHLHLPYMLLCKEDNRRIISCWYFYAIQRGSSLGFIIVPVILDSSAANVSKWVSKDISGPAKRKYNVKWNRWSKLTFGKPTKWFEDLLLIFTKYVWSKSQFSLRAVTDWTHCHSTDWYSIFPYTIHFNCYQNYHFVFVK